MKEEAEVVAVGNGGAGGGGHGGGGGWGGIVDVAVCSYRLRRSLFM